MTDEMTIQPQVKQRNPLVPTVIAGGVGAAGAYGATHWYNQSKGAASYEDLIAEVKDKTDFSTKKEPAKWSDFKAKADKIASLDKQIAEMPEKVLPENDPLATARKTAQEKFDAKLAEMIKAEEAKLGTSSTGKLVLEKELDNVLLAGEKSTISGELRAYNNAVDALRGRGGGTAVSSEFNAINTVKNDAKTLYEMPARTRNILGIGPTNVHKQATSFANSYIRDSRALDTYLKGGTFTNGAAKLAYVEKLAQEHGNNLYNISSEVVSGSNVVKIPDAYGAGKHAWVTVDRAAVDEARKGMVDMLKENARQYKALNQELTDIANKFLTENQAELSRYSINDVTTLNSSLKVNNTLRNAVADLEARIGIAERNGSTTLFARHPVTNSWTSFSSIDAAKDAIEEANKKIELTKKYHSLRGPKIAEQNRLINAHPGVIKAKQTYQEAIANNTSLKNAIEAIKNKLTGKHAPANGPDIWAKLQPLLEAKGGAVPGTVDKAALEKLLNEQRIGKDLKTAIENYNAALAEKGVANTAAKEALQAERATLVNEAKKIGAELAHKKLPKGWIAAGVGTALALAGYMYSTSNKS